MSGKLAAYALCGAPALDTIVGYPAAGGAAVAVTPPSSPRPWTGWRR